MYYIINSPYPVLYTKEVTMLSLNWARCKLIESRVFPFKTYMPDTKEKVDITEQFPIA